MSNQLLLCFLLAAAACGSTMGGSHEAIDDWDRIMNGEVAAQGEFPSQLSLRSYQNPLCGASILNEEWAMTAATCVSQLNLEGVSVLSGTIDRHTRNGTEHNATEIIIHPDHVTYYIKVNDIALIKVTPPFDLDGILRKAVTLPQPDSDPQDFSTGIVIGWGRLQQGGPPQDLLHKANVVVSNQTACRQYVHDYNGFILAPTQISADVPEEGLGSCFGDEGGPLFVNGEAFGMISWMEGCAPMPYKYSIFTRVSSYIDWIDSLIGSRPNQ